MIKKIIIFFKDWIVPCALILLVIFGIRHFVIERVNISGSSMEPSLHDGNTALVMKMAKIHRGSVIVFDATGEDPSDVSHAKYIKRVIGLPGDKVTSNHGNILVNEKKINQSFISKKQIESTGSWSSLKSLGEKYSWTDKPSYTIPKNEYFVLGDHRSVSNDSRYWGFVHKDKITGVAKEYWWASKTVKANINHAWKNFIINTIIA